MKISTDTSQNLKLWLPLHTHLYVDIARMQRQPFAPPQLDELLHVELIDRHAHGAGSQHKESQNLPAFVVLNSTPSNGMADQGLLSRLWGAGFLPSQYQGVQFRGGGDAVLHLSNPPGVTRERRRSQLDGLAALNKRLSNRWMMTGGISGLILTAGSLVSSKLGCAGTIGV